jgi:hypothetical protein
LTSEDTREEDDAQMASHARRATTILGEVVGNEDDRIRFGQLPRSGLVQLGDGARREENARLIAKPFGGRDGCCQVKVGSLSRW